MEHSRHEGGELIRARRRWFGNQFMTWILIPAILAAVTSYQAKLFRSTTSATYDEPLYLQLGLQAYHDGSFAGFIRPMIPPLPILLTAWLPSLDTDSSELRVDEIAELMNLSRSAATALIGIPLVLVVHVWLARRRGWIAGALGGGLVAFSPNILAHVSVSTVDACFVLFTLVALAALIAYRNAPTRARYLIFALTTGLAMASKQSAVFLFPVAALIFLEVALAKEGRPRSFRSAARILVGVVLRTCGVVILSVFVNWALYGFACAPILTPGLEHPTLVSRLGNGPAAQRLKTELERLPCPAPITAFLGQVAHNLRGHDAFLLGQRSRSGWLLYYPTAFALKSTPSELILALIGVAFLLVRKTWTDPTRRVWVVSALLFTALCVTSKLDTGIRYMLIIYPLLSLLVVDIVSDSTNNLPVIRWSLAGLLLVVQVGSAANIAPHYMSYFNFLAGGPENGYRYVADSNIDWGQDLPALKEELKKLESQRPILAYFGECPPEAYGVHAIPWNTPDDALLQECDYLAISVSYVDGINCGDVFAPFREIRHDARAAFSIYIWDARRPEVSAALSSARKAARASPAKPS
jgi:4-amino-4-deoxy-L-arabinose transferase-like glycosyltransferase